MRVSLPWSVVRWVSRAVVSRPRDRPACDGGDGMVEPAPFTLFQIASLKVFSLTWSSLANGWRAESAAMGAVAELVSLPASAGRTALYVVRLGCLVKVPVIVGACGSNWVSGPRPTICSIVRHIEAVAGQPRHRRWVAGDACRRDELPEVGLPVPLEVLTGSARETWPELAGSNRQPSLTAVAAGGSVLAPTAVEQGYEQRGVAEQASAPTDLAPAAATDEQRPGAQAVVRDLAEAGDQGAAGSERPSPGSAGDKAGLPGAAGCRRCRPGSGSVASYDQDRRPGCGTRSAIGA